MAKDSKYYIVEASALPVVDDVKISVLAFHGIGVGDRTAFIEEQGVREGVSVVLGEESGQIVSLREVVMIDEKHSARFQLF